MMGATFKDICGGDVVTYMKYAGRGRNGPEYRKAKGWAIGLLLFEHHVIVGNGRRGDMGSYVDKDNYIDHKPRKDH